LKIETESVPLNIVVYIKHRKMDNVLNCVIFVLTFAVLIDSKNHELLVDSSEMLSSVKSKDETNFELGIYVVCCNI
jgi:hypothetical protein